MKKIFVTSLVIGILGITILDAQRVEKNLQNSFEITHSSILEVDSKFGEVRIMEGDDDVIEVIANIWVESNNRDRAEEILASLDAEITQEGNRVVVSSILPGSLNTGKKTTFRIDFDIYTPATVDLELSSKYGTVYIEEISGHSDISVAYGNINFQELSRGKQKPINTLELAYSSGNIEEAGWLKMDLSYSKLSIEEAQALVVLSKYSGLSVEECSSIVLDSKYDNFSFGELNNFLGELKYSNLKIDELYKKLDVESAYGAVKVEEISEEFESIKLQNVRGGYKLNISEDAAFTLNGIAVRGDISVSGMDEFNRRADNADIFVDGIHGNNPTSTIDIESKEGGVKIVLE